MCSRQSIAVEAFSVGGATAVIDVAMTIEGRNGASLWRGADGQNGKKGQCSGAKRKDGFQQW